MRLKTLAFLAVLASQAAVFSAPVHAQPGMMRAPEAGVLPGHDAKAALLHRADLGVPRAALPAILPADRGAVLPSDGAARLWRVNDGARTHLPPRTRIVPLHVYKQRSRARLRVPGGYRKAWDDDRLNPLRAYQTIEGYYATQRLWTNTVPRRSVATAPDHRIKDPVIVDR